MSTWFYTLFKSCSRPIKIWDKEYHKIGLFLFTKEGNYEGINMVYYTLFKYFAKSITINNNSYKKIGDFVFSEEGVYRGIHYPEDVYDFSVEGDYIHPDQLICLLCCACCCPSCLTYH
jgi:hypothetical protein